MHYVQINLGRNVAGTPMSTERWAEFKRYGVQLLQDLVYDVEDGANSWGRVELHDGVGSWQEYAGLADEPNVVVTEESAHISTLVRTDVIPAPEFATVMTVFTRALRQLAEDFDQDAIALITGSRCIKPRKAEAPAARPKSPCYCDSAYHPAGH